MTSMLGNDMLNQLNRVFDELKLDPVIENLPTALSLLNSDIKAVQNQLSQARNEGENYLKNCIYDVEKSLVVFDAVQNNHNELELAYQTHLEQNSTMLESLKNYGIMLEERQLQLGYIQCLKTYEQFRVSLEENLRLNEYTKSAEQFRNVMETSLSLQHTKFKHLLKYINDFTLYWHETLKNAFSKELDAVLKILKWPAIVINKEPALSTHRYEVFQKLEHSFELLLRIQLPNSDKVNELLPPILPLQIFLQPLSKRFLFHFSGSKSTNNICKPEWYLSQILVWVKDSIPFCDQIIQPILDKCDLYPIKARFEMMRALNELAIKKLTCDLPKFIDDDVLMSHTIDEVLSFEKEFMSLFNYPTTYPTIMNVLTKPQVFNRWLKLERQFTRDKMDQILSSDSAWSLQGNVEVNELRVTEAGESLAVLLFSMSDRYKLIRESEPKLKFLELQTELLDEFRIRLIQIGKTESKCPINSKFCSIVNTISYLVDVFTDWLDSPLIVKLRGYQQVNHLPGESSSGFEEIIGLLSHLHGEMMKNILEYSNQEIKMKLQGYKQEKFFALPNPKDFLVSNVSSSACYLFASISLILDRLHIELAKQSFTKFWQNFARKIDQLIYQEIVMCNQFNDGGGAQFVVDIKRGLYPIFQIHTSKPEFYFMMIHDACTILSLPRSTAMMISNLGIDEMFPEDVNIICLSYNQIQSIINNRLSMDVI